MADDTENHTIKLLQEMRGEMRDGFAEMNRRFEAVDERFKAVDERFDSVDARIDGVTHILTLMAAHTATIDSRVEDLEAFAESLTDTR